MSLKHPAPPPRFARSLPRASPLGERLRSEVAFLALLLGACSPSPPLACPVPAATSCPSLDGVTSFCGWAEWGCASEHPCNGYFILVDEGVDARFTYYYAAATGEFVATVKEATGGGNASCLAGPPSFQVPSGCSSDTLAECAPPPRDGGANGASDAATDAPSNPPSPSGSPSTQPLSVPPSRFPSYPSPSHPPR